MSDTSRACSTCSGTGEFKSPTGARYTCQICGGTGNQNSTKQDCTVCKGSGKIASHRCEHCSNGKVWHNPNVVTKELVVED